MKNLKVIENELVPVYETSIGEKVVYGSELHAVLGVKTLYKDWSTRRLNDIDAIENEDFQAAQICAPSGQTKKDHIIRLDIAKEMAMLERNDKGKQVRRYFIEIEKKYKQRVLPPEPKEERLDSVNEAVKILAPMMEKCGCNAQIQLLTAKVLYEKTGVDLPILIESEQQFYDTTYIARKVGIRYDSSKKPADKPINQIIHKLDITPDEYTETWESKGKWQGTVRKYTESVINKINNWIIDNQYPNSIEYTQSNGQKKKYHVIYDK